LGLKFDGIYSGFLGSLKQIDIVEKFIKEFRSKRTKVIIDPVMGDYGKKYATYTDEMCAAMKRLVSYADVLTPNLTEACVLTDTPYKPKGWKIRELEELAEKLLDMGCKKVVITGIPQGMFVTNLSYMKYDEKEWEGKKCTAKIEGGFAKRINKTHLIGCERSGTGDVFASIVAADTVNGVDLITSARRASHFVKKCLTVSEKIGIPVTDGVCFEEIIDSLKVIR
nr:bifunctional hydroxymethylpyrimidine kinase/phosphomethylpyrimidine kinase [Parasporobacterium sp.]